MSPNIKTNMLQKGSILIVLIVFYTKNYSGYENWHLKVYLHCLLAHHELITTILSSTFVIGKPNKVFCRCYKNLENKIFGKEVKTQIFSVSEFELTYLHLKSLWTNWFVWKRKLWKKPVLELLLGCVDYKKSYSEKKRWKLVRVKVPRWLLIKSSMAAQKASMLQP